MVRTLYLPRPQPEPLRFLAIGVSIALNAALFMALMQPPSSRPQAEPLDAQPKVDVVEATPPAPKPLPGTPIRIRPAADGPPAQAAAGNHPSLAGPRNHPVDVPAGQAIEPPRTAPATALEPSAGNVPMQAPLAPVDNPAPAYPPEELHQGIAGTVQLELLVGVDGRVLEAKVVRSSGNRHLDAAARQQVLRHWIFKPARVHGAAAQGLGRVAIVFSPGHR